MKWLVTGASGMLGTDVRTVLDAHGIAHTDLARADVDLTNEHAVNRVVHEHDVVVNCAAWTAVDDAEAHEHDAFVANAVIPAVLGSLSAHPGRPPVTHQHRLRIRRRCHDAVSRVGHDRPSLGLWKDQGGGRVGGKGRSSG